MSSQTQHLSTREFADKLREAGLEIGPSTVSAWCKRGLLQSIKLGPAAQSPRRIPHSELTRVLNGGLGQVAE